MPRRLRQLLRNIRSLIGLGILVSISVFGAVGCAQIEAPSGGPEDKTPPEVESTFPESLAVHFDPADSLVIQFSETMNKASVEDWIFMSPEAGRLRFSWEGSQLSIYPQQPLHEETTYVLLLASQMEDRRRNDLSRPVLIPFSTGGELDPGRIEGQVKTGRLRSAGAFVFAWRGNPALRDSVMAPPGEIVEVVRRGQVDAEGGFHLSNLPLNEPLTLCALHDSDENRSYDPKGDLWGCLPEAVVLSDTLPELSSVQIYLVYPDEPGTVSGLIVDSLCIGLEDPLMLRTRRDSLRALLEVKPESLRVAPPDTSGTGWAPEAAEEPETEAEPGGESEPGGQLEPKEQPEPGAQPEAGRQREPGKLPDLGEEPAPWEEWESWATDTTALSLTPVQRAEIDSALAALESRLEKALEESAYCARPVWVEAYSDVDSPHVAATRVKDIFTIGDLQQGDYWLRAYRDLDFNREWTEGEPRSDLLGPLTLEPARTLEELEISLPVLPRPWPEDLLKPPEPETETLGEDTESSGVGSEDEP